MDVIECGNKLTTVYAAVRTMYTCMLLKRAIEQLRTCLLRRRTNRTQWYTIECGNNLPTVHAFTLCMLLGPNCRWIDLIGIGWRWVQSKSKLKKIKNKN